MGVTRKVSQASSIWIRKEEKGVQVVGLRLRRRRGRQVRRVLGWTVKRDWIRQIIMEKLWI